MGRGGKQGAGSAALAEAQSLMLHSRLDDAAATALTALGAPPAASSSAWEEVIDELPPAKKPTASVVQLSCIAIQSALRLGKAESAAAIAGALYAPQGADAGAVAAAAAAPVEVALSLAHGLASSDRRDDAEKVVRARLKAGGSKGGNGSDTPHGSPSKSAAPGSPYSSRQAAVFISAGGRIYLGRRPYLCNLGSESSPAGIFP
jgi:hypothetical protein